MRPMARFKDRINAYLAYLRMSSEGILELREVVGAVPRGRRQLPYSAVRNYTNILADLYEDIQSSRAFVARITRAFINKYELFKDYKDLSPAAVEALDEFDAQLKDIKTNLKKNVYEQLLAHLKDPYNSVMTQKRGGRRALLKPLPRQLRDVTGSATTVIVDLDWAWETILFIEAQSPELLRPKHCTPAEAASAAEALINYDEDPALVQATEALSNGGGNSGRRNPPAATPTAPLSPRRGSSSLLDVDYESYEYADAGYDDEEKPPTGEGGYLSWYGGEQWRQPFAAQNGDNTPHKMSLGTTWSIEIFCSSTGRTAVKCEAGTVSEVGQTTQHAPMRAVPASNRDPQARPSGSGSITYGDQVTKRIDDGFDDETPPPYTP